MTRRWKACNPVVKDQHPSFASIPRGAVSNRARVGVAVHAASPASTRGASAAPVFSSGGATARRASGAPGSPAGGPALQRQPPRRPHATCPTYRVNGAHGPVCEEHLPPAKSTRGCPCSHVAARAAVPFRRLAGAFRLGALERARPRPRSFREHRTRRADFCNRRETRAHPRDDRDPARATVTRRAVALQSEPCRYRAWPEPYPKAAPSPEARAWLHGGLDEARYEHPRRERRLAASDGAPRLTRPTKAAAAHPRERAGRGRGRGAFQPCGDGAHCWCRLPRPDERDDAFSSAPEPPSTKPARERTAPNDTRGGSAPARKAFDAASLRPSRETCHPRADVPRASRSTVGTLHHMIKPKTC